MRAKDILSSQTKAFSLFELLICVAILGILLLVALPKVSNFSHQKCIFTLREKLQKTHNTLLELYSTKILKGEGVQAREVEMILDTLTQREGNTNCYFQRSKNGFVANIEGKKLNFLITPNDLSYKPKIYCQLSNELCRDFLGKTSKK